MIVHGFTMQGNDTYPYDEYVLATTKEEVAMLRGRLTDLDYHRHRIPRFKKLIQERVYQKSLTDTVMEEYDSAAKARVDFTCKCLETSEKIVHRYGGIDEYTRRIYGHNT